MIGRDVAIGSGMTLFGAAFYGILNAYGKSEALSEDLSAGRYAFDRIFDRRARTTDPVVVYGLVATR